MSRLGEVARFRAANRGAVALATRDLNAFWSTLNLSKPEAARDALLEFLPVLTDSYGDVAATVAADFYEGLREASGIAGRYTASLAGTVPHVAVQQRTRFGAQHLFTDDPDQMLKFLTGAVSDYVQQPGRDTIALNASKRDPAASGWHREARPTACEFCVMLVGRGGVYKKQTADFAAHDNCHCIAVPSWDANAPEVPAQAYVASERTSKMDAKQRERHRATVRDYLASL